jgi:hypothetical protein
MMAASEILIHILRQAWMLLAGLLVLVALLGGLAQLFRMAGGVLLGANFWVSEAVLSVLGVTVITLVGFLSVPAIARSASVSSATGCGPMSEVGQLAGMLIGAIGALRMLKGVFLAVVSTSISGSGGVSRALMDIAETILGMLLITVAAPVAAAFFGAC